jgi:hypothetical protein
MDSDLDPKRKGASHLFSDTTAVNRVTIDDPTEE